MKCKLLFATTFALMVANIHAQVRELWVTGLTNTNWFRNYQATVAAIDDEGNTIVGGGKSWEIYPWSSSAFLAKFDSAGNGLWEYNLDGENWDAQPSVEGLITDSRNNIYFTVRPFHFYTPEGTLLLKKLSPDGRELWQAVETNCVVPWYPSAASSVAVDADGNVVLLVATWVPSLSQSERIISKFDKNGRRLWRTKLPGKNYLFGDSGVERTLSVCSDNSLLVVGGIFNGSGFVAKLNKAGQLLWLEDRYKGKDNPVFYSRVLAARKNTICASSFTEGATIFDEKGKALHTDWVGGDIIGPTSDGGFLLGFDDVLYTVTAEGKLRWLDVTELEPTVGAVADGKGGWFSCGFSGPSSVGLFHCDSKGGELSKTQLSTQFPQDRYYPAPLRDGSLLRAPDGSLRIVLNVSTGYGYLSPFEIKIVAINPD